jgi:hypothetical protein
MARDDEASMGTSIHMPQAAQRGHTLLPQCHQIQVTIKGIQAFKQRVQLTMGKQETEKQNI